MEINIQEIEQEIKRITMEDNDFYERVKRLKQSKDYN